MNAKKKNGYRKLISSTVIFIFAAILVIVGAFLLGTGLTTKDPTLKTIYILTGTGFIIISALFFVIINMADDLHELKYISERYEEEISYYCNESLQMMENIEKLLQLQCCQERKPSKKEEEQKDKKDKYISYYKNDNPSSVKQKKPRSEKHKMDNEYYNVNRCNDPISDEYFGNNPTPVKQTKMRSEEQKTDNEYYHANRYDPISTEFLGCNPPSVKQAKIRKEKPKRKMNWIIWTIAIALVAGGTIYIATNAQENAQEHMHVHDVDKWTVIKEASCAETGLETGTCTVCKETVERSIPKSKHTEGEWKTVQGATIDSPGLKKLYCSVCGAELRSEPYEMSRENKEKWFKTNCQSFSAYDLESVARNPNSYYGKYYKFKCKITQIVSESISRDYYSVYRAQIDGKRDADIYLCVDRYGSGNRILEDDYIYVYGSFDGLKTYTTVLGASVTVPKFNADYYTR